MGRINTLHRLLQDSPSPNLPTLLSQPTLGPLVYADLTGRVVIVTNANTDLGLAFSKHLADMNPAKLVMAVRNAEKGEKALQDMSYFTAYFMQMLTRVFNRVERRNWVRSCRSWRSRSRKLRICQEVCSEDKRGQCQAGFAYGKCWHRPGAV